MRFKSLTFGTLFVFLSVNSFSQTQKPVPATNSQPQKVTPATNSQPQKVTPTTSTQSQRTIPATAEEIEARKAADATRTTLREGEDIREFHLTPPERGGGRPLMEVLNERRSTRRFSQRELEPHIMSGLLWAANGVNRDINADEADGTAGTGGKRTTPSARDAREIDIYVVTAFGVYLYLPDGHHMKPIKSGDYRKEILGKSTFAYEAPIVLVYVANNKRMEKFDPATKDIYAAVDCGFISQNVYLYCASEHLSTVILGNFSKEAAARVFGLKYDKALFAQPVGHKD